MADNATYFINDNFTHTISHYSVKVGTLCFKSPLIIAIILKNER